MKVDIDAAEMVLGSELAVALHALRIVCASDFRDAINDEQDCTPEHGFTNNDRSILSNMAYQYLNKRYLSEKQTKVLFKRMPKYAKQYLIKIGKYEEEASAT